MNFKIGNKVKFRIRGESKDCVGRVGRHHHKKSRRLVIRGSIPFNFEVYLSTMKKLYGVKKFI